MACRLLFVSNCLHNVQPSAALHTHDFWQMELITGGAIRLDFGGASRKLQIGTAVLIPPGTWHGFDYYRKDAKWLSFKFRVSGLDGCDVVILEKNDLSAVSLLQMFVALYADAKLPGVRLRMVSESLLAGVLSVAYSDNFEAAVSPLVREVENYIAARIDTPISVDEVAAAAGYSANHLGVKFREQTGMGVKEFIDLRRAGHAKHLLEFSDRSIGQIAGEMGFDNIYAFSRFFKRVTSHAPSAVRKKHVEPA